LSEIIGQYEESEEISSVAREFVIIKHKRKKYRCKCNGCIETALGPKKLQNGSRYSIEFAIDVGVAKYIDHLPLQRQVKQISRSGLEVTAQSLWDQINVLAKYLEPSYQAIMKKIKSSKSISITRPSSSNFEMPME